MHFYQCLLTRKQRRMAFLKIEFSGTFLYFLFDLGFIFSCINIALSQFDQIHQQQYPSFSIINLPFQKFIYLPFSLLMEKKTIDLWINQGKKNCKSYVFYQNKVLDLSDFVLEHPGGIKAIKNYVFKDVTNIIFQVYPHHKDTTMKRLMKFHVGFIPDDQVTSARTKAENTDRPKQKKKVCFTGQNDKMASSRVKKSQSKDRMSKSVSKNKQNLKQSTMKSSASKKSNKSQSKSKNKQFLTSIRIINQCQAKTYDDYFNQNQKKLRQKQRSQTQKRRDRSQKLQKLGSCSFVNNQLDQQKPNFKIPILAVKHMNKNY